MAAFVAAIATAAVSVALPDIALAPVRLHRLYRFPAPWCSGQHAAAAALASLAVALVCGRRPHGGGAQRGLKCGCSLISTELVVGLKLSWYQREFAL